MYEEELAFANELADIAADIGMRYFRGSFEVRTKEDKTPVTQADTEIESALRKAIAIRFPGDAVLGEEYGLQGESDRVWVIDPIDGTKNYAAGIQIWATLIALLQDDDPVVGVAAAPALGERYEASRGTGARFNGEPVHVSSVNDFGQALVCSSGGKEWITGGMADAYASVVERAARTRAFGDFWGHMLVARGSADAMLEPSLRVWDWAAVRVIVEEAGGQVTALDGGRLTDRGSVLTSNGRLHEQLISNFSPGSPG